MAYPDPSPLLTPGPLPAPMASPLPVGPPPSAPPSGGGEFDWKRLLEMLPLVIAGLSGGKAGVAGYARGAVEARQIQAEQARRDAAERRMGEYQQGLVEQSRAALAEREAARREEARARVLEMGREEVPRLAEEEARTSPVLDLGQAADAAMPAAVARFLAAAERFAPGHGITADDLLAFVPKPGAGISGRKRTAYMNALTRLLKDGQEVDWARAIEDPTPINWGNGLEPRTLKDVFEMTGMARPWELPAKATPPKEGAPQIIEMPDGTRKVVVPREGAVYPPKPQADQATTPMVPPGIGAPGGESALEGLSDADKALVKGLVDYRIQLPSGMALRTPYWQQLLSRAALYDPTFDQTQYNARVSVRRDFNSGKAANNIRSLNTAVGHLGALATAGKALENSSVRLWNAVKNAGLTAVGDDRVKRFLTAANAVAGELATIFKGTAGTDQEIKAWRAVINEADSPEQIQTVIDAAVELLASRLDALTEQYRVGMGKPKDFTILSQHSQGIIKTLGVDVDVRDPVAPREVSPDGGGQDFSGAYWQTRTGQKLKARLTGGQ